MLRISCGSRPKFGFQATRGRIHRIIIKQCMIASLEQPNSLSGKAYKDALLEELEAIAIEAGTPGTILNKLLTRK